VALRMLMNYMCSCRMKEALPLWLNYYEAPPLTREVRQKLLAIRPSSIDRVLRPHKEGCQSNLALTMPEAS
jgi:tRNA U34 5-carboxymethylaminomethyl modifying enzyme MnmG/GidA